ncbi:DNL zinc finger-domain-containing protein [Nemania serpens]|nr:DNL zinc finger-domain-containing protein [Nemania serpens]
MASRVASRPLATVLRTTKTLSPPLLRTLQPIGHRFAHVIPKPTSTRPARDAASSSADATPTPTRKQLEPHYQLTFTCVPCGERSGHVVSKQGYHRGSVLITCPSCRNRHVISDNLNIFGDRQITVEDLLREKGQLVKRGTLGEDGDIEFWEDTPSEPANAGEASAASVEPREDEHDAAALRETRDPSSQAADPAPHSASILPGSASTRPSVHPVSHQRPAPSTRRQFHAKRFKPPTDLANSSMAPLKPANPSFVSEVRTSHFFPERQSPYDSPDPLEKYNQVQTSYSHRLERQPNGGQGPNKPLTIRHVVPRGYQSTSTEEPNPEVPLWIQKMVERREKKEGRSRKDRAPRNKPSPDDPSPSDPGWEDFVGKFETSRRNDSRVPADPSSGATDEPPKFTGPRFVIDTKGTTPGPKSIQVEPGLVLRKRPPGGIPQTKSEPKLHTFRRPSFLPILTSKPVRSASLIGGSAVTGDSTTGDAVTGDAMTSDTVTGDSIPGGSSTY